MNTLAIDIGGTKFTAGLFEGGALVKRETRATDRAGGRDWMLDELRALASAWILSGLRWDRCGIGFGGPVLFDLQRVALSTHVGGWSDFDFTAWAQQAFSAPAVMDNDANVGGLGEAAHGAGRGVRPLIYVTLSTGVGGGLILDSGVYRGADSYAGELGHICIQPDGPECLCGARGCLERFCGGLWLERDYGRPAKELLREPGFVEKYVVRLAAGLKTCIMVLNPARIVIGGGISKAGNRLFGPLREELARQMTPWSRARIDVQPAALGDDSVLYGALELAKHELPRTVRGADP